MAIDKNVYEEILNNVVLSAKQGFPERFLRVGYDKEKGWGNYETVTINQFVGEVYTNFESNDFFDEANQVGKEARDASFAASRALQVVYGVCAAEEIKTSLNNFFSDKKNDAWFKEKGITDEEKTALRAELTNAVDERILGADTSRSNQRFVSAVKNIYSTYSSTSKKRDNFLSDCFSYIDWLSKEIVECNKSALTVSKQNFEGTPTRKAANRLTAGLLNEAVFDYVTDVSKNMTTVFTHDSHKGVKPHEFLEHYKADPVGLSQLSKSEKDWADNMLNNLLAVAQSKYGPQDRVTYSEFLLNGEKMISDEHSDKVISGEKEFNTISAKIIGGLLDGEDISVTSQNTMTPMHINSMIVDKTQETWWERLWQNILNFLHRTTDMQDERKKAAELNDNLQKHAEKDVTPVRERISFEDIKETTPFAKAAPTLKEPPKKEKGKTNSKSY